MCCRQIAPAICGRTIRVLLKKAGRILLSTSRTLVIGHQAKLPVMHVRLARDTLAAERRRSPGRTPTTPRGSVCLYPAR